MSDLVDRAAENVRDSSYPLGSPRLSGGNQPRPRGSSRGGTETLLRDLGARLGQARHRRGWTQEHVAKKLGCHKWTVMHIEAGKPVHGGFPIAYMALMRVEVKPHECEHEYVCRFCGVTGAGR